MSDFEATGAPHLDTALWQAGLILPENFQRYNPLEPVSRLFERAVIADVLVHLHSTVGIGSDMRHKIPKYGQVVCVAPGSGRVEMSVLTQLQVSQRSHNFIFIDPYNPPCPEVSEDFNPKYWKEKIRVINLDHLAPISVLTVIQPPSCDIAIDAFAKALPYLAPGALCVMYSSHNTNGITVPFDHFMEGETSQSRLTNWATSDNVFRVFTKKEY